MWWGTNHKACAANYNLLWALPTHFIASFFYYKPYIWVKKYFGIAAAIHAITALCWFALPQHFNIALLPIVIMLAYKCYQIYNRG